MGKMKRCLLNVEGLLGSITSNPHISMAMKKTLDKDIPVLDELSHRGSDRHASFSISDGIRNHLRPIISKSSKPVFELRSRLVSSAYTVHEIL